MTHTPGPWEAIPANEHHGAYVVNDWGSTVCDLYTMSNPSVPSVRNGGDSSPVPFFEENADANARLIAAAPDLLAALIVMRDLRYGTEMTYEDAYDSMFKSGGRDAWHALDAAIARATTASKEGE